MTDERPRWSRDSNRPSIHETQGDSVRREFLDWLLIRSANHLEQVLTEFARHYNAARPHRGLQAAHANALRPIPAGSRKGSAS